MRLTPQQEEMEEAEEGKRVGGCEEREGDTHGCRVDEDDYHEDHKHHDDAEDDMPLVVLPNNELEGFPRRGEPQE